MRIFFTDRRYSISQKANPKVVELSKKLHQLYDSSFIHLIKLLEKNKLFEEYVVSERNNAGIPEGGYSIDQYYQLHNERMEFVTQKKGGNSSNLGKIISKLGHADKVWLDYEIDPRVASQMANIIVGNFVQPVNTISLETYVRPDADLLKAFPLADLRMSRAVQIEISGEINKQNLIDFIEENWSEIENGLKETLSLDNYYVSKKDWRAYELVKQGLRYKHIPEMIEGESNIDNYEGTLNEGSLRKNQSVLRKKINDAFKIRYIKDPIQK